MSKAAFFSGTVIGDALGTPFDGLKEGHIKSVFKKIEGFTDALPAIKSDPTKWRKPALYSATGEMALIAGALASLRRPTPSDIASCIRLGGDNPPFGIFRHPENVYRNFILCSLKNESITDETRFDSASAALIPLGGAISAGFPKNGSFSNSEMLRLLFNFTTNFSTIAATLIYSAMIKEIIHNGYKGSFITLAKEKCEEVIQFSLRESAFIFDTGINPDTFTSFCREYSEIFASVTPSNLTLTEEKILEIANRKLKSKVTRCTVDIPSILFPYAVTLSEIHKGNHSDLLYKSVEKGGASSSIAAIAAGLAGAASQTFNADKLADEIINKKRLFQLIESIAKEKLRESELKEFIENETSLTAKEIEEFKSKTKHVKEKAEPKKSNIRKKEEKLTRHIVESWTKLDKARWKKEQRRKNDEDDGEF